MQQEQYTNVRIETMNKEKFIRNIKHNLRMTKQKSSINNNKNFIYINDNLFGSNIDFETSNKEVKSYGNKLIKSLDNIRNEHKDLLRKNTRQSITTKHNSHATGILTFSDSITNLIEEDKQLIIDKGIQTIKDICLELDTPLYCITLHLDEEGLPHFHFETNGYNSKGESISIKRNKKRGEVLQDIGNKHFQELGFKRGIPKSETKKRHLNTYEYKKLMEENDMLKNEIKEQKELVNELVNQYTNLHIDYIKDIKYIINELEELTNEKEKGNFLKKLERAIKGNTNDRLEKLLFKYKKSLENKTKKIGKNCLK